MAGKSGIQWDKGYSEELKRQIRNYNARITAAQKRYPGVKMPDKLKYSEVKATIKTKRQYNVLIKDIEKATSKSLVPTKQGITKYEKQLETRQKRRESTSLAAQKAELRRTALQNILVDKEPGRFPTERNMILQQMGLKEGEEGNYERLSEWLTDHKTQSQLWKDNYLQSVSNAMDVSLIAGDTSGVERLTDLYNKIASMDLEDFLIGQLTKPAILSIQFLDSGQSQLMLNEVNRVISEWESLYG